MLKTLDKLNVNDTGIIQKVNSDEVLKKRLFSFGIHKGSQFLVKNYSLTKKTIEIELGQSLVALRFEEAKQIDVEEVL